MPEKQFTGFYARDGRWMSPNSLATLDAHRFNIKNARKCKHCRRAAVRGMLVCRSHGGGNTMRARDREQLLKTKSPLIVEAIERRLERSRRNILRAHRNVGEDRRAREAAAEAQECFLEVRRAISKGMMTNAFYERARALAVSFRRYREPLCVIAAAEFCLEVANGGGRSGREFGFSAFASRLGLDKDERARAREVLMGTGIMPQEPLPLPAR